LENRKPGSERNRSVNSSPHLLAGKRRRNEESHAELHGAYERLLAAGVQGLHYLPGKRLLGDDDEGTVDSSHPTDLGFMRQADAFAEVLKPLLE
jgi:hypothetical protein